MEQEFKESLVKELVARIGTLDRISLDMAKELIERVEQESKKIDLNTVISVCGPDGNMVATHVMDGALLVSIDVAVKKAYTAVALKAATIDLAAISAPGGPLWGLDRLDNGRIIVIGGGVPLMYKGKMIGGLGVSGGTGEQDHSLASFGASTLE